MGNFRVLVFLGLIGFALSNVPEKLVDTNTIFFRVFRGGSHRDINIRNVSNELLPFLDLNNQTTFYIHGHTESVNSLSVFTVVEAYLSQPSENIVAIDYSQIAGQNYIIGVIAVDQVGNVLANVLNQLVANGLNQSNIQIVGHSLGAQVSGHIGQYTNFKIPRIVGLDPAGPLFYTGRYLTKDDAQFVVVIHTDAGILGDTKRAASVDFWPNGGHRKQPGCPLFPFLPTVEVTCDHHRSWRYFAESITNQNAFLAVKCDNEQLFNSGSCSNANSVIMGWKTPTTARGSYYLRTNSRSPFGLGERGTK